MCRRARNDITAAATRIRMATPELITHESTTQLLADAKMLAEFYAAMQAPGDNVCGSENGWLYIGTGSLTDYPGIVIQVYEKVVSGKKRWHLEQK